MRAGLEVRDHLGLSRENVTFLENDGLAKAGYWAQIDHNQGAVDTAWNVRVVNARHQKQLRRIVVVDRGFEESDVWRSGRESFGGRDVAFLNDQFGIEINTGVIKDVHRSVEEEVPPAHAQVVEVDGIEAVDRGPLWQLDRITLAQVGVKIGRGVRIGFDDPLAVVVDREIVDACDNVNTGNGIAFKHQLCDREGLTITG